MFVFGLKRLISFTFIKHTIFFLLIYALKVQEFSLNLMLHATELKAS